MKFVVGLSTLAIVLLAGCSSMSDSPTKVSKQHAAHHPEGVAPVAPASAPAGYEQQMKAMQEMHQKAAAAKTPAERTALMKDHMKAMHDGMGMMGQMGGGMMGGKAMDPEMMKRRMDMMEMMMQMMMDREGMKHPASK